MWYNVAIKIIGAIRTWENFLLTEQKQNFLIFLNLKRAQL